MDELQIKILSAAALAKDSGYEATYVSLIALVHEIRIKSASSFALDNDELKGRGLLH